MILIEKNNDEDDYFVWTNFCLINQSLDALFFPRRVRFRSIKSYFTMSYFTMSYITLSYHVISYHVPYHVIYYHVLSCHILPCLTMSYLIMSYHAISYITCLTISYCTMSCRVIFTGLKWELENNSKSAIHFHVLNRQLIQLLRHKRKKVSLKEMRALGFFLPPSLEQCWVFKPWNVQRVCKLWKCPILWNVYQKLVGKDSLYHCQACT